MVGVDWFSPLTLKDDHIYTPPGFFPKIFFTVFCSRIFCHYIKRTVSKLTHWPCLSEHICLLTLISRSLVKESDLSYVHENHRTSEQPIKKVYFGLRIMSYSFGVTHSGQIIIKILNTHKKMQ